MYRDKTFSLEKSIEIIERTPNAIRALTEGLNEEWTHENEGPNTWSVFDIVGHLVHGEKTDWITRMNIILEDFSKKEFEPFDRYAQMESSKGKTLSNLLDEFDEARKKSITILREKQISTEDYCKTGVHPNYGEVTLQQLLATWVVHDLNHIAQINRVMAKQYTNFVGPWFEFLRVLKINP